KKWPPGFPEGHPPLHADQVPAGIQYAVGGPAHPFDKTRTPFPSIPMAVLHPVGETATVTAPPFTASSSSSRSAGKSALTSFVVIDRVSLSGGTIPPARVDFLPSSTLPL